MKNDVICGMAVDERTARRAEHEGQTYYFCGDECRNIFLSNPTQRAARVSSQKTCCCSKEASSRKRNKGSRFAEFWIVIGVGLLPLIVGCSKPKPNASKAGASLPVPEVQVRGVTERLVPTRLEFTGKTIAAHQVDIRARVSGYVTHVPFAEGAVVPAGALLFEIDPRPFVARHEEAKAEVARAKAAASLAQQELARAARLSEQDAIAKEEVERRNADLQSATAALDAALAKQEAAALDLEFTKVKAPVSGRVGRALVKPGNLVSGGDATATLLTTLVAEGPMHALFHLDEPSYQQITAFRAAGKKINAEVRLGTGDRVVTGVLDYIGNVLDARSGTAQARTVIDNPTGEFAPGLFARVTVTLESDEPNLLVPESAVGAAQGVRYVLVVDRENKLSQRRVSLGARNGNERLITDGLAPGETIVVNGLQRVRPGMTVRPVGPRLASN